MSCYKSKIWTDEKLFELVFEDDSAAFTELYDRYWMKLFVIATNKLRDKYVAEELTQDILADIWQRRKQIKITTSFNAYLAVSMKYKIIDYLARLHHRRNYTNYMSVNASEYDNCTENWLSFEDLRHRLEKHVSGLPDKCQVIYRLSKEQGYKNKQIAINLGISEKTVEAHLARAMKVLRSKLSSFMLYFFF